VAVPGVKQDEFKSEFEIPPVDSAMLLKSARRVCSSVAVSSAPMPCVSPESSMDDEAATAALSGTKLVSSVEHSQNSVPPIVWKSSVDCGAARDEKSKACRSSRRGREGSI